MNGSVKKIIHKISEGNIHQVEDTIAVEKKLKISINGEEVISLYCTPTMIRELVVGLLLSEGLVKGSWCSDRMSIEYKDDAVIVSIQAEGTVPQLEGRIRTSGCIGGVTFEKKPETEKLKDDFTIDYKNLMEIFRDFQNRSEFYRLTGCIHSAALSDGRHILVFAEDIGRHNAVDKVIGYCLLEGIGFENKIMLASGRLSSEITSKCSKWGIPVIASRTAPTHYSVEIAEARGLTLVGFVRGNRLNIYTHPHRIKQ